MSFGEVLVSLTIILSALAGFNAAASQHSAVETIFKLRIETISKIRQDIENQKNLIRLEKLGENCEKLGSSENCEAFKCFFEDLEYSLCLP